MANGFNTYSNIQAFVCTIYEDALTVARESNILASMVRGFSSTGMAVRQGQIYGTASVVSIGETDDLASQVFTPVALSTLTPAEAGAQFLLTDQRLETDPFNVRTEAARELGYAAAQKIETDIISDFPSLTGGTVGGAGTVLTWGHFFAGLGRLRAQMAPAPYTYVLHPYQWHVLGKAVAPGATVTNSPALQNEIAGQFYVGSVSGVNIYTSMNLPIDSSDDAVGAMFSRDALALDMRRGIRIEPERDASRRAWELNMSTIYAHGVWRPKFGVQMKFDAALPLS